MVSLKDLKTYDFESIDNYFEYIVESLINGQKKQVNELINELSINQKKQAFIYYNDRYEHFFSEAKQLIVKKIPTKQFINLYK